MSVWRGAKLLVRYEWATAGYGVIFNLVLIAFFGIVTTPLFLELREGEAFEPVSAGIMNFMMFAILPCLGFFMNKTTFNGWQEDYVSCRLAAFRQLPISFRQLAAGKLLTVMTLFIPSIVLFIGLQYALLLNQLLSPLEMLNFLLFWMGYGVGTAVCYAFLEMTMDGKKYFAVSFVLSFLFLGIGYLMALMNWNIMLWLINQANRGNWIPTAAALAVGVIVYMSMYNLLVRSLSRRTFIG